jgi:Tol biopolymer transport system component
MWSERASRLQRVERLRELKNQGSPNVPDWGVELTMALEAGTRLGAFEITGSLGAGGMGEVYRATDTKLGREVAIKTLPSALAGDADRLARFEREAKLLAALNHAHIAAVYGLDEHEGTQYLAMELVEGETLEQKLKAGPLPVEEALRLALQIAEALEAAHEKGVVHRDLKPANIMVTPQDEIKVLDFGLAKAFSGDPNEASPAHSPALSMAMTQQGLILGTAGYMSPEQASGQATDQRADVWAFGVVVYEMLTGLPLFSGESVPHILAAVLQTEPDWNRLPQNANPRLKLLLERCLAKKPRKRLHSIADARLEIEDILDDPRGATVQADAELAAPARSFARRAAGAVVFAVIGGLIAGAAAWTLRPEPESPITRFSVDLAGTVGFLEPVALSPDGRRIVYAANGQLYSQRLDQDEPTAIPGTELGSNPFFSPDGESVAFFTQTQLKTVGFAGQLPRVIADVHDAPGLVGAWDRKGRIFFGKVGSFGLSSVPAVGGEPAPFADLAGYADLDYPDVLPGEEWVLFTASRAIGVWSDADIVAQNIATGERKVVLKGGGHFARYLSTGHLLFVRGATLMAAAFDPKRLEVVGPAVPVVQGVSSDETGGHSRYAVASNGTLIYAPGSASEGNESALVHVDLESGEASALSAELRNYDDPRVSPDGMHVATSVREPDGHAQIWVTDLSNGGATQLTFEGTQNRHPVWTRDGREVLYTSRRGDVFSIYRKAADGTGETTHVLDGSERLVATDVLPGDVLVYQDQGEADSRDLLTFDLDDGGAPMPFLATAADEYSARVSPDGAWIAYLSNETGETRVYVRPYPSTSGGQRAVSQEESSAPVWSRDGHEIYFVGPAPGRLISVSVASTGTTITPSRPQVRLSLFAGRFQWRTLFDTAPYDALPNGGIVASDLRGLPSENSDSAAARPTAKVVLNWFDELRRLAPTQ